MTIVIFVREAIESLGRDTICSDTRSRPLKKIHLRCGCSFDSQLLLSRHRCVDPPLLKRSKWENTMILSSLVEDPIKPPERLPFSDALSTDLLDVVREHWSTIQSNIARGPIQTRYNYRMTTLDTSELEESLNRMFQEHTTAFKINLSYGFVLKNKVTGRYK